MQNVQKMAECSLLENNMWNLMLKWAKEIAKLTVSGTFVLFSHRVSIYLHSFPSTKKGIIPKCTN